jgi:hypothetical protein
METEFATGIAEWRDFYAAIAGAAATLLGLLFVSMALNPAVMRDDSPNGMRVWAAQTFHNFLVVLAIALTALIPDQSPPGMGILLAILGVQGMYRVARDARIAHRDPSPIWRGKSWLTRFAAPAVAYILCSWAAVEAFLDDEDAMMGLLIPVIFLLVISASSSCWDLLKEIGNEPHDT